MLLKVFSSVKQEEFSASLGVLDFVVYPLLIVYKPLSSVEFKYSVWVCDEDVKVREGWMSSCW